MPDKGTLYLFSSPKEHDKYETFCWTLLPLALLRVLFTQRSINSPRLRQFRTEHDGSRHTPLLAKIRSLSASMGRISQHHRFNAIFLAQDGKINPQAELQATLDTLYHSDPAIAEQARCTYPARYTWIESQLGRTAQLNCPELNNWRTVIDPAGMTLVFPTAFMNNPSSMFGHTLLRIDAKIKLVIKSWSRLRSILPPNPKAMTTLHYMR
ncbi:DUF7843 domain-containing protein [Vibrio metschnikovii]